MDDMAPMNPPMPTTDATALRGNMSLTSVNRLQDHHWCAAAAMLTSAAAGHMPPTSGAKAVGTMATAASSNVVFRAAFTVQPRAISMLESHPPPTDPKSATT